MGCLGTRMHGVFIPPAPAYTHTYTHTCTYTHIHTYTHTHIHTYTHTHCRSYNGNTLIRLATYAAVGFAGVRPGEGMGERWATVGLGLEGDGLG